VAAAMVRRAVRRYHFEWKPLRWVRRQLEIVKLQLQERSAPSIVIDQALERAGQLPLGAVSALELATCDRFRPVVLGVVSEQLFRAAASAPGPAHSIVASVAQPFTQAERIRLARRFDRALNEAQRTEPWDDLALTRRILVQLDGPVQFSRSLLKHPRFPELAARTRTSVQHAASN